MNGILRAACDSLQVQLRALAVLRPLKQLRHLQMHGFNSARQQTEVQGPVASTDTSPPVSWAAWDAQLTALVQALPEGAIDLG